MAFETHGVLRFGDCDPSGIAYFPTYFDKLVGVLEEFFASIGKPWPELVGKDAVGTPTVRLDVTFAKPGFHGDSLLFKLEVVAIGRSSLDLRHTVSANGATLWSANHRIVATSLKTHKAVPWPDDLRKALETHLESHDA
jgi:4-hydroxybenzoyl-CoA thioesterase